MFVYAIRSSLTRDYYLRRLRRFFDFLELNTQGTIEERCNLFAEKGKVNPSWVFDCVLQFLQFQKVRDAKMIVYAGDEDEYLTFLTAEAYFELEKWMAYRSQCGESISDKSWIMRHIWNTKKGHMHGLATAPRKLKAAGVKRLIEDA